MQPSKNGRAFDRGREDYADQVFINPYKSPLLRKRWDAGFAEAAQERRRIAQYFVQPQQNGARAPLAKAEG